LLLLKRCGGFPVVKERKQVIGYAGDSISAVRRSTASQAAERFLGKDANQPAGFKIGNLWEMGLGAGCWVLGAARPRSSGRVKVLGVYPTRSRSEMGGLGTGYWGLGTGYWVLGSGYWVLGTGYWGLGSGFWVLGSGFWVLGSGCWGLGAGYWVLGAGCWVLGAGCWVLGAGCWELGAGPESATFFTKNKVSTKS